MPAKTKILYTTRGETFDPIGALIRHPSIRREKGMFDITISGDSFPLPAPDGYEHNIDASNITFTLTLDAQKMAALTRILDSAPVDGRNLSARVSIDTNTDAEDEEASQIEKYLAENEMAPTVENVAEAYLHTDAQDGFIEIRADDAMYRATRVDSVDMQTRSVNTSRTVLTRIVTSDYNGKGLTQIAFEICSADHSQVEGEAAKNADFTAARYYAPTGKAPLGGILMVRTNI